MGFGRINRRTGIYVLLLYLFSPALTESCLLSELVSVIVYEEPYSLESCLIQKAPWGFNSAIYYKSGEYLAVGLGSLL